jgi:hypothetical protein
MDADSAANRILRALPRRPKVYNFPRRMMWLMRLVRWMPDWFLSRQAKKTEPRMNTDETRINTEADNGSAGSKPTSSDL